MKTLIHRAETRGGADHGWLQTFHTFSFADYYDPLRMNFGALRVLNDDTVAPGEGFGMHRHDNMEVVSIPLEGSLEHRDSIGNVGVIRKGEVQVMSAGTGIFHSEYNPSESEAVKFLQIWILPRENGLFPRYSQVKIEEPAKDTIEVIVAPQGGEHIAWINQDAWLSLAHLSAGNSLEYNLHNEGFGVYLFVLEGAVMVGGEHLYHRDGMGVSQVQTFEITADTEARLLLIEVPMH